MVNEHKMSATEFDIATAYAEGVDARLAGKNFKKDGAICPYTFDQFELTYAGFDQLKRPLLDAWFDGFLNKPAQQVRGVARAVTSTAQQCSHVSEPDEQKTSLQNSNQESSK